MLGVSSSRRGAVAGCFSAAAWSELQGENRNTWGGKHRLQKEEAVIAS